MDRTLARKLLFFLVMLLICGLVFWGIREILPMFGLPQPVVTVIWIILAIVVLLAIVDYFGVLRGPPSTP